MAYTQPNAVPYRSAAGTDACPTHRQAVKYLLPDEAGIQLAAFAFDQAYEMLMTSFPPAVRNTRSNAAGVGTLGTFTPTGASVDSTHAILTRITQPTPTGAGMGQFNAEFCVVPATWDDYSKNIAFTFPGFPGIMGQTDSRNVFSDVVQLRVRHEYYVVDPSGVLGTAPTSGGAVVTTSNVDDSGGTDVKRVYSLAEIPIVAKSIFVVADGGTPDYSNRTESIVPAGGKLVSGVTWYETLPTLAAYKALISNARTNGWASTVWDGTNTIGTAGQLVAVESTLQPYAGNIIERVTGYILVK